MFAHWGDEYTLNSNDFQKKVARSFIDVEADLVIASHPHVIQESEIYKGKYIYYSLGNYIFDQWFSEDVKAGLAVNFLFSKKEKSKNQNNNENNNFEKEIKMIKEIKVINKKTEISYEK